MSGLKTMYEQIIRDMGVAELQIPITAVKFFKNEEQVPQEVMTYLPQGLTLTSCQACKQAGLGDPVCLTRDSIGCVAAAITFGLVDQNENTSLAGPRVYTDIMKEQADLQEEFVAPSPKDFTEGIVYACKDAERIEFALFGKADSGRYKNIQTAQKAIREMMAIQPPTIQAVFMYPYDFSDIAIPPDVVVMSVRPVELTRLIQAYQYNTGKRIKASMGGLRVVNSDLIVRPYLTQEINISTYCLGARLIAKYEANRLGIGIPFKDFEIIAQGMADSRTGFPFHQYPGADHTLF